VLRFSSLWRFDGNPVLLRKDALNYWHLRRAQFWAHYRGAIAL
jgi:hypothetical protein